MMIRIVLGVLLGLLLIAFYPALMQGLPYILLLAAIGAAFFILRTVPALAEPLGYGLLVVLLCYITYLIIYKRKALKDNMSAGRIRLPRMQIPHHPRMTVFINTLLYMLGLTFVCYVLILLIYVQ